MAGDWIKLEHATPRKPEVSTMAEMLGVSLREMMGILVDYLLWVDVNTRHANVTLMSRKSLDSVLQCDGLSACLEFVGWVKWDDAGRSMTISNYERHNGESAKNRALATERKRKQRSRECHDDVTEKRDQRREEKSIKESREKEPRRNQPTRLPDDWSLPNEWATWALKERKDWNRAHLAQVSAVFADYWRGKGEARASWLATWRNWVRRDKSAPFAVVAAGNGLPF